MYKSISVKDDACKYIGIWQQNNEDEVVSYGTVSWFKIGFSGQDIVLDIKILGKVIFYLDNQVVFPKKIGENIIQFKTTSGKHVLKIKITPDSRVFLKGIEIPKNETVFKTEDKPYFQFIGDSITYKFPGYSSIVGDMLDVDYSIVAYCGMSLKDGWGWYKISDDIKVRPGMESMYFKLERPHETYDFTDYNFEFLSIPDALIIALGTNDYLNSKNQKENGNIDEFVKSYLLFVEKLRNTYPDARVYILKPFNESYCRDEAVTKAYEVISKRLGNAVLIDSINWNVEISSDGTHPTEKGYLEIAENLVEFLRSV